MKMTSWAAQPRVFGAVLSPDASVPDAAEATRQVSDECLSRPRSHRSFLFVAPSCSKLHQVAL